MKQIAFIFLFISLSVMSVYSQGYNHGIGVHFSGIDFYGTQSGKYFLQDHINPATSETKSKLYWDPSVKVSYWHSLNKRIDVNAGIQVASLQYPTQKKDSNFLKSKTNHNYLRNQLPYFASDLKVNINILDKVKNLVSPYFTAGLSGAFHHEKLGIDFPLGLGINISLGNSVFINLESDYRMAISKINQSHLTHGLGIVYWWKSSKKPKTPIVRLPEPPVIKDKDNDGIPDIEDSCPTLPGRREMKGCPDRDNDGIADNEDLCPELKGLKNFNGCPDSDGDGIQDSKDDCPSIAGTTKYKGCPIPDTDQDGFNNEIDKCPDVASATNNGCPEVKQEDKQKIEIAAQGIFFESGSAVITKESFANLDKIVSILKKEPSYLVDIEGHTDNIGTSEKNLELSQKRADACMKYLISNGIDESRISSIGYGDIKPIADNSTAEGRAKNRRTEFNIKSF